MCTNYSLITYSIALFDFALVPIAFGFGLLQRMVRAREQNAKVGNKKKIEIKYTVHTRDRQVKSDNKTNQIGRARE